MQFDFHDPHGTSSTAGILVGGAIAALIMFAASWLIPLAVVVLK
jgi:hypothetical protein